MSGANLAPTAGAVTPSRPSGDKHATTCWEKGSRTIAADAQVRVYASGSSKLYTVLYACLTSKNQSVRLGESDADSMVIEHVEVAGPYVSYDVIGCNAGNMCAGGVRTIDVRTGRRHTAPAPYVPTSPLPRSLTPVSSLVLTPSGTSIWIRPRSLNLSSVVYDVYALPFRGPPVRLASSPTIAPTTLATSGGAAFWIDNGLPQTAALA